MRDGAASAQFGAVQLDTLFLASFKGPEYDEACKQFRLAEDRHKTLALFSLQWGRMGAEGSHVIAPGPLPPPFPPPPPFGPVGAAAPSWPPAPSQQLSPGRPGGSRRGRSHPRRATTARPRAALSPCRHSWRSPRAASGSKPTSRSHPTRPRTSARRSSCSSPEDTCHLAKGAPFIEVIDINGVPGLRVGTNGFTQETVNACCVNCPIPLIVHASIGFTVSERTFADLRGRCCTCRDDASSTAHNMPRAKNAVLAAVYFSAPTNGWPGAPRDGFIKAETNKPKKVRSSKARGDYGRQAGFGRPSRT